jgi:hypothetical protein
MKSINDDKSEEVKCLKILVALIGIQRISHGQVVVSRKIKMTQKSVIDQSIQVTGYEKSFPQDLAYISS